MKVQRFRFRVISLFLLCAFLFAALLCMRSAGFFSFDALDLDVLSAPLSGESDIPVPEEAAPVPEASPAPSPTPQSPYDTNGL